MTENVNDKLGLPTDKMAQVVVCFDIDGTLRNNQVQSVDANEDIRTLIRIMAKMKNTKIIVWSGGGELYARQIAKEIHIDQWVDDYMGKSDYKNIECDIAIDDIHDTALGKINLIVREK